MPFARNRYFVQWNVRWNVDNPSILIKSRLNSGLIEECHGIFVKVWVTRAELGKRSCFSLDNLGLILKLPGFDWPLLAH